MARTEQVVLTNMCMINDGKGNVLVQNRLAPESWCGMAFPGGHVECGESFSAAVIREVFEETGLTIEQPHLCGVKHFHRTDGTRYIVFLYKAEKYTGTLRSSDEGEVSWIPMDSIDKQKWVPDFDDMLGIFLDDEITELFYYREDDKLKRAFY